MGRNRQWQKFTCREKEKAELRNELYYSAFNEGNLFNKPKTKEKTNIRYDINDDNKSTNTKESRSIIQERYNSYNSLVKENKSKLLKESEDKNKIILEKSHKLTNEERNKIKENYKNIIFGNNSVLVKKTDEKNKRNTTK